MTAAPDGAGLAAALRRLAREPSYAAYAAVGHALQATDDAAGAAAALMPVRIAVLRNFTIEPLLPVLEGELALSGLRADIVVGPQDLLVQEALAADSPLFADEPRIVIVALWLEALSQRLCAGFAGLSRDEAVVEATRVTGHIEQIVAAIRGRTTAPILVNNFALPAYPAHGIADAQSLDRQTHTLIEVNRELVRMAARVPDLYVVDFFAVAARVGAAEAWDARTWQLARAPIGRRALIEFGRHYATFVRALLGRSRKVLVLDCDDTLWGGVIGEDGLAGIRLGEAHPGSSYQAFQREIIGLHDRGVVLALASKNNEADVLEVLRDHPGMLLRERHLAAWQIDWDDKASNLRRLAHTLNLGLDAFVFADDSEFECDLVRESLPEVAVVHLKGDPAGFSGLLRAGAHFDGLVASDEDRRRNQMYRGERRRERLRADAPSLAAYLGGLGLRAEIAGPDRVSTPRIAQLTQKTNQFNLTTHRYTEAEIHALADDPRVRVLGLRLRDAVDDLGLIGVAIVRLVGEDAEIEALLVSCRALGRGAEDLLLAQVVRTARARGASRVIGLYRPTAKNAQVADFYGRHGFVAEAGAAGRWHRALGEAPDPAGPPWITVATTLQDPSTPQETLTDGR